MADSCIHIANLFYLASFLVRDMLWLRIMTCGGMIFGILFFTCQTTPLYGPTFWHIAFLGINLYQIVRLQAERRSLQLSPEQEAIRQGILEGMTDDELLDTLTHTVQYRSQEIEVLSADDSYELSSDEIAFQKIAFGQLSRNELINLLSREMWQSMQQYQVLHRVEMAEPASSG